MQRAQKSTLCLADLVASGFDAASELGGVSSKLTACAIAHLLLRTNNTRALSRLLKNAAR
jgi:hypothetical protein